jgi:hypothetical protein
MDEQRTMTPLRRGCRSLALLLAFLLELLRRRVRAARQRNGAMT